jgi:hypothetical protein
MSPAHDAPAVALRASGSAGGAVRVQTRNHDLVVNGAVDFADRGPHATALEHLLAALAAEIVAALEREAARAGVRLAPVELKLEAWLDNPLAALGVVGETGGPELRTVRGTFYAGAPVPVTTLREWWERARLESPVHATLARAVDLDLRFQIVL